MLEYSHARNCPFCGHIFQVVAKCDNADLLEKKVMEWADGVAVHMHKCFGEKEYAKEKESC